MIETEDRDGVRILRLAHGKASALDLELVEALRAALANARNDTARAIVLTGSGSIFCAGVDLIRIAEGGPAYVRQYLPAFAELMFALAETDVPLVVAANGHAIAGGAVLLAAGDRRLLADGPARVGYTEHQVGVCFPPAALELIRFGVPARQIERMLYGAATYPADEALALGFADEIVPPEDLTAHAIAVARQFAEPAGSAFAVTKRLVRAGLLARMREAEAQFADAVLAQWCAAETHATIGAYLDRVLRRQG
ncbi:MAG: enoyl-CoA hydratase/isomerase family protein [Rhizobiales bacterium]|nr:enoyl-CoA hydratase/isomerase family protein [Hyphomicrobiales bacterium]